MHDAFQMTSVHHKQEGESIEKRFCLCKLFFSRHSPYPSAKLFFFQCQRTLNLTWKVKRKFQKLFTVLRHKDIDRIDEIWEKQVKLVLAVLLIRATYKLLLGESRTCHTHTLCFSYSLCERVKGVGCEMTATADGSRQPENHPPEYYTCATFRIMR